MSKMVLVGMVLVAGYAGVGLAEELTYVDLVSRLTDLERLAVLPVEGEKCGQWSSYDRASVYDEQTGKYVRWDANGDGGGFIREENGKFVLAEMEGPGCTWRMWSAEPLDGHVRIFLDGAAEPAVDLPFRAYFDRSSEPFTRSALVYNDAAKGSDCYVPIPYQKSCKIVADPGWGRYFHFTYGTFPKGTVVPTFKRELSPVDVLALNEANTVLSSCGPHDAKKHPNATVVRKTVTLKPRGEATVLDLEGAGAITSIHVELETPVLPPTPYLKAEPGKPVEQIRDRERLPEREAQRNMLRELAIAAFWDDEDEPSVWAPLGDFFGTAAGANAYVSFPSGLTQSGTWYSHWYMPFGKEAEVKLYNDGLAPRTVTIEITHAPLTKPNEQLGRFHAKWHRDAFLPTEAERSIDWTLLKTEGRGRYCGVMLHVWNPRGRWWGEGDEKFFVDGEKFPSTFGTGSEDYFGYAWSNPTLFSKAFHNQTLSMNNRGHISVDRWQLTDNVPFQTSFEGCIERYFKNPRPCLYAGVAYWYLAADGKDPYRPQPLAERVGYWNLPPDPNAVEGAIEGENMAVIGATGGEAEPVDIQAATQHWSGFAHLLWGGVKVGNTLDLALPVENDGTYMVVVQLTKSKNGGIVQPSLDGEKLRGPIDLYAADSAPFGPFDMGALNLKAGEHKLRLELVGANPTAATDYSAGLDYVKLDPAAK